MSDNDVEDVSFLPGDALHRKSRYEPSVKQKCKRLVLGQGRATVVVVIIGIFILVITVIASLARPGSSALCAKSTELRTTPLPSESKKIIYMDNNKKEFPWQSLRLPDTSLPMTYNIYLHPNLTTYNFTGVVDIVVRVTKETDLIILHSKNLIITATKVTYLNGVKQKNDIKIKEMSQQPVLEQFAIKMEEQIPSSTDINLNIKFHAQLSRSLLGFYLSSFKTPENKTVYIGTTQFEAVGARRAFPCFDEPQMKANFSLSMVREKDHLSLFNMPLKETQDMENNLQVDHFDESVKMSSYLVAFMVLSDYGSISNKTKQGTKVSVYAPKYQMDETRYALECAISILNYYNDFFGIKYPLPKQDLVAIPDFDAGAMENWGLITYRLVEVLYDPKVTPIYTKERVTIVIAHELAHQWFGNLVTMKWWNDLWLNEGFASYVENLGANKIHPEFNVMDQFLVKDQMKALITDSMQSSHPISTEVRDPNQINELFDDISYRKGSSIIRMAKDYLGEKFRDGLHQYLVTYQYQNAESQDLWTSLNKFNSKINVTAVMDTWTKQMGYPVVTVVWNKDKKTATLSQKRFLLGNGQSKTTSPYGYKWYVPFWYSIKSEKGDDIRSFFEWLNMESVTVKIPPGSKWIKGNYGMKGFYRVNYENENWNALNKQLLENHMVFSAADRAGIIDDAFALARSGELPQTLALDMTKYLKHEDSYAVWKTALHGFRYLEDMLYKEEVFQNLKVYVLGQMEKMLQKLGFNSQKTVLESYLQKEMLKRAVKYGHQKTKEEALKLFHNWVNNNDKILPNLRLVVYKAGIKFGSDKDWEFVLNKYKHTTVPSEKRILLTALADTQNIQNIYKLLGFSLDSSVIRAQDFSQVIHHLSLNPVGELPTWNFVQQNWDKIYKMLDGLFAFRSVIKQTSKRFSTKFLLDQVTSFYKNHKVGSGKRQVQENEERISMNIAWKKRCEPSVTKWLQENGKLQ